jgi:hypothetical protein
MVLEVNELEELLVGVVDAFATSKTWENWKQGDTGRMVRTSVVSLAGTSGSGLQHLSWDIIVTGSQADPMDRQRQACAVETEFALYVVHRLRSTTTEQHADVRRAWSLSALLARQLAAARHQGLSGVQYLGVEPLFSASAQMVTMAVRFRAHHTIQL